MHTLPGTFLRFSTHRSWTWWAVRAGNDGLDPSLPWAGAGMALVWDLKGSQAGPNFSEAADYSRW